MPPSVNEAKGNPVAFEPYGPSLGPVPATALLPGDDKVVVSFTKPPLVLVPTPQPPLATGVFGLKPNWDASELDLGKISPTFAIPVGKHPALSSPLIPDDYSQRVEMGRLALKEIEKIAIQGSDPKSKLPALLKIARESAELIRKIHTKDGLNEYASIENWQNLVFSLKRDGKNPVPVEGVMIGFNMQGLNGLDASMKSGTAMKEMTGYLAPKVAQKMGLPNAQLLGTWGNNLVVSGVSAEKVEEFRKNLLNEATEFLSKDQDFPDEGIKRRIGAEKTSDLKIRNWAEQKDSLGFTVGHAKKDIPASVVEKAAAGDLPSKLAIVREVLGQLKTLGDREAYANIEKKAVMAGDVPADHPAFGQGVKPLLKAEAHPFGEGTRVSDIPVLDVKAPPSGAPSDAELLRLPRPGHEGGIPLGNIADLERAVATAQKTGNWADVKMAGQYADNLAKAGEIALHDYRFGEFYRPEAMPFAVAKHFGKAGGYVQLFDIKNFYQINKQFPGGFGDEHVAKICDVLVKSFRDKGLDAVFSKQGDEIYVAIRAKGADGSVVTPERIGETTSYVMSETSRIFSKHVAIERGKIPGDMGGYYHHASGVDAEYAVKDGKVYVEKGKVPEALKGDLLKTASKASELGLGKPVSGVAEIESFGDLGPANRVTKYETDVVDPISGEERKIYMFLPGTQKPAQAPQAVPVESSIQITGSKAVYMPGEIQRTVSDPREAIDLTGELVKKQKSVIGPDMAPEAPTAALREGLADRPRFLDSPFALYSGKLALGATEFGVAVSGARLVWGLGDMTFGGDGKMAKKVVSAKEYAKLGLDFGVMTGAGMAGEALTALAMTRLMKMGKIAFAGHAVGIGLGTIGVDLLHKGKLDWGTAVGAGMMLAAHGVKFGLQAWRRGSLAAAAADPEPVSKTALAVECLIFEGLGYGFEKWHASKIDGMEKTLRLKHAAALKNLDQKILGKASKEEFAQAAKEVKSSFASYAAFLQVFRTESGEAYQSAVSAGDKAEAKKAMESDFKYRISKYDGQAAFVPMDVTKADESYAVNLAMSPEGLAVQYQSLVTKRVKVLVEQLKLTPKEAESYLAYFGS